MVGRKGCFRWLLGLGLLLLLACGRVGNPPEVFERDSYTAVDPAWLANPGQHSLQAGHRIFFRAYFWEFLSYDPCVRYYYFNQLRYPCRWGALEWFAVYRQPTMTGYFDRLAMTYAQRLAFQPKRLDPVLIYGELLPFGGQRLYLMVHHLEPAPEEARQ